MELNELKAKAYDLLASIEQAQMMLRQVNQQIIEANKPEVKEETPSTTE